MNFTDLLEDPEDREYSMQQRAAAATRSTHDLIDRAIDDQEVEAIRRTLTETPGVSSAHDLRTRKMGDMIVADAHLEVDAAISVEAGHTRSLSKHAAARWSAIGC